MNFVVREALKEAGIYDHIVETIVDVRNRYGAKDATKGISMILKTEMIRNPKLLDVFMDDIEDLGFKTVGGSEFHEMNNQNRQVPLDDYSPVMK